MTDGTVLWADVFRPQGDGPWPVLLARSPYSKRDPHVLSVLEPEEAARRGFLTIVQDVRGRFRSDGDWLPLVNEREDGAATIRWAANLPGADGRVAMFGPSYLGASQWAALSAAPDSLVAVMPGFSWADPHEGLLSRGGTQELGLITQWTLSLGLEELRRRDAGAAAQAAVAEAMQAFDASPAGAFVAAQAMQTLQLLPPGADTPAYPIPAGGGAAVLTTAGWYDAFLKGSLDRHAQAVDAGHPAWLVVGPWTHDHLGRRIGEVDFGQSAAADGEEGCTLVAQQLDWFDRRLRSMTDIRHVEDPPVRIFVMGINEWRTLPAWPPPAHQADWHLLSDGSLSPAPAPQDGSPGKFDFDETDPPTAHGGSLLLSAAYPAGPFDQRGVEARADVLVYTSDSLERSLDVIGPLHAELLVESDPVQESQWVVRLCDVDPSGGSLNIADGIIRAPARSGPQPIIVDLWATAYVFRPGHRIRVHVTGGCSPRWGPCEGVPTTTRTVHHIVAQPSKIVLPVTRGAS